MSRLAISAALLLGHLFSGLPTAAVAADKYDNSLDWVPADVAFYASQMRLKEQVQIVAASKAWQKFRSIPTIAQAWQIAEAQLNDPNGPAAMGLQLLELPENQQLVRMLGDIFSNELVAYGGASMADLIELYQAVNRTQQLSGIAALGNPGNFEERSHDQQKAMLDVLKEHKDLLHAPEIVLAAKLTDAEAAKTQLKRLEVIVKMMLQRTPYGDRFQREKVGNSEFLTVKLDGSLVPWDEVPFEDLEETDGEYDDLKKTLSEMTLVISLGVRDNYLLLSINRSNDALAKLGEGKVLANVSEFSSLAKYRSEKLVSIGYLSKDFASRVQMNASDIDDMVESVGGVLEVAGVEDDKLKDRIAADIEKLGDDFKKYLPEAGAQTGFTFLTPTGYEGYSYNWTQQPALDGSKPLGLLNHVGGKPILAFAARGKYDPDSYALLVKWIGVAFGYFEEFAVPQMPAEQQRDYAKGMEIAKPLIARANKATQDFLVPSLKDGQSALVLDAKIASKQWQKDMPKSSRELPMAELALVMGVSDPELFRKALQEYKAIADELVVKIREQDENAIPADFKIPWPKQQDSAAGTLWSFKLPAEAGLDDRIAPSGGLGSRVAVFSTSPQQATRVLAESPLPTTALGSATTKPCAVAFYFDWAGLVNSVAPWVEFAIRTHGPGATGAADEEDPQQIKDILSQVRTGIEILKCWKTTEGVTTIENGVLVGHHISIFHDVE